MSRRVRFWLGGLAALALAAAVCLPGIAEQPFYTKGEPREALVVWEMAHGGGIVLPLRNGTEIPSKPPLFHWLGLLAAAATGGVSELAARLPSAVLAIAIVVLVYAFGATVGRVRSGWLAATAVLLCFEFVRAARIARVDMTVTFFLFGALLLFGVMDRSRITRARLVLFYACLAAATLGKGPIGLALPAAVILTYGLVTPWPGEEGVAAQTWRDRVALRLRGTGRMVAALAPARGVLAVVLVSGAWYAAAWAIGGNDFFVKHVLKENLLRVFDPDLLDTGHRHGPFYLLPQWFLGALPWSLLAPGVAWFVWRARPLDPTLRYLVVWFVTVLVFFSIPASKRGVYLLPAYPAGALLLGLVLGPGPEDEGPRRLVAWGFRLAAVTVGVVGLAALVVATGIPIEHLLAGVLEPKDLRGALVALAGLRDERWTTALAGAATIGGAVLTVREARGAHWLRANVALSAALVCGILFIALPVERAIAYGRSLRSFFAEVRETTAGQPLAFFKAFDYGAVYYAGRHIPTWRGRLADPGAEPPPFLLLWEDEAARQAPHLRILAVSSGADPKGRKHMVLAAPERAAGGAADAAAPRTGG